MVRVDNQVAGSLLQAIICLTHDWLVVETDMALDIESSTHAAIQPGAVISMLAMLPVHNLMVQEAPWPEKDQCKTLDSKTRFMTSCKETRGTTATSCVPERSRLLNSCCQQRATR